MFKSKIKNLFRPTGVKFKISLTVLTLLILWLALMPAASAPSGLGWDKLNHAGAIAVVTGLAYLATQPRRWAVGAALAYGIFLGVLIEVLQGAVATGRAAEWGDVAADLVGVGAAWIAITLFQSIKNR
ncbi:MAG: VanZ family protein [Desulfuromonadaceae bacterium]